MKATFAGVSVLLLLAAFAFLFTSVFYAVTPPPQLPQLPEAQVLTVSIGVLTIEGVSFSTVTLPVGQPYSDHATAKHDVHALRAEQCGLSPTLTMYNPTTRRFADVCTTVAGLLGAFIYEVEEGIKREVTAFEKDKMRRLEQIIRYLENQGYTSELPPLPIP